MTVAWTGREARAAAGKATGRGRQGDSRMRIGVTPLPSSVAVECASEKARTKARTEAQATQIGQEGLGGRTDAEAFESRAGRTRTRRKDEAAGPGGKTGSGRGRREALRAPAAALVAPRPSAQGSAVA